MRVTYGGVVGGDVEQNFRGASAGYVSVAVPHARDQVGLPSKEREQRQIRDTKRALPLVFRHPPISWFSEALLERLRRPSAAARPPVQLTNQLRSRFNALTAGLL